MKFERTKFVRPLLYNNEFLFLFHHYYIYIYIYSKKKEYKDFNVVYNIGRTMFVRPLE